MKTLAAILLFATTAFAQSLNVTYEGKNTAADLSKMSHEQLHYTNPHDKSEHTYSCVSLTPILASAGVPQGEKLRGKLMSLILVASAKDHYHAVFSLAELDVGMGPTKAFICDADSGKPLPESEAPLKLLVTTDKRPARSVRMLTGLAVNSGIGASAGTSRASTQDDEAAIRKVIADNTAAFNGRDPAALAAHLTDDADHIGVSGAWTYTRADFEKSLKDYFTSPRPTTSDQVERVRFPLPDVAIAIVKRQYVSATGTKDSTATYVLIKQDDKWSITAFQNTFAQKN